jgi:serine O-acetyltransferase
VEYHVGDVIDGYTTNLSLIAPALRHEHGLMPEETRPILDLEALAQQKAIQLLQRLPDLRAILEQDVESAYAGDPAAKSYHEIIFCYPGLMAVTVYPIAHEMFVTRRASGATDDDRICPRENGYRLTQMHASGRAFSSTTAPVS